MDKDQLAPLLAATEIVVGPTDMALVGVPVADVAPLAPRLPWQDGEFLSLTVDDMEASLILPWQTWQSLAADFPQAHVAGPYRLLTFDIVLDLGLVGYLAAVTTTLADRGICVYALSAYSRDHLLIRAEEIDVARQALAEIVEAARQ
ncbi:MAG: ACT domain-containing protein [Chloroflexota bacterium]